MSVPIRWLMRVATALGLASVLLTVTPVTHDYGPVAAVIEPGALGGCGDGTCGYVVK